MLLYHYCSVETMMKIITEKHIRLCNALKSNDSTEFTYFDKLCEKFIEGLGPDDKFSFLKEQAANLGKELMNGKNCLMIPYIACFSEDGDVLSQWRGYADNGCGVAIGFDFSSSGQQVQQSNSPEDIRTPDIYEPFIVKMEYDESKQKSIIDNILAKIVADAMRSNDDERSEVKFTNEINKSILYAIRIKQYGFKEENEHRLVKFLNQGSEIWKHLSEEEKFPYEFFYKKGMVTGYFKFKIDPPKAIKKIVLGPKCPLTTNVETENGSDFDYEWFSYLHANGLEKVEIERSKISYR